MSLKLQKWFFNTIQEDPKLRVGKSQHAVMVSLCFRYNEQTRRAAKNCGVRDRCYVTMATLEKMTGLKTRQICTALNALRKKGLLTWRRGHKGTANAYSFNCPDLPREQRSMFDAPVGTPAKIVSKSFREIVPPSLKDLPSEEECTEFCQKILKSGGPDRKMKAHIEGSLFALGLQDDEELREFLNENYEDLMGCIKARGIYGRAIVIRRRIRDGQVISSIQRYFRVALENALNNDPAFAEPYIDAGQEWYDDGE